MKNDQPDAMLFEALRQVVETCRRRKANLESTERSRDETTRPIEHPYHQASGEHLKSVRHCLFCRWMWMISLWWASSQESGHCQHNGVQTSRQVRHDTIVDRKTRRAKHVAQIWVAPQAETRHARPCMTRNNITYCHQLGQMILDTTFDHVIMSGRIENLALWSENAGRCSITIASSLQQDT